MLDHRLLQERAVARGGPLPEAPKERASLLDVEGRDAHNAGPVAHRRLVWGGRDLANVVSSSLDEASVRTALRVAAAFAAVELAAIAAGATPRSVSASTARACGVELWSLKTLSDPQRKLVNLHPRNTTVPAIDALPMPHPTPATRSTNFERQVWRVSAQVVQFKLEGDSDIHLILFGQAKYMIAEMPLASCLPKTTRDRKAIVAARARFVSRCGQPSPTWQSLGAVGYISGVGFWDFPHGQSGAGQNYAELHPVTAIRIVSGCG